MKENHNIEELLNSFIDAELTARQRTEVERLIAHDAQIAQRLRQLQKCKMLVGSLPLVEAPSKMAEEIKASLETRTLLSQPAYSGERFDEPSPYQGQEERKGVRHLLIRKVLAAAAMIGLVAILAAVIYTIVAPESVLVPRPSPLAHHPSPLVPEFNGKLELKTSTTVAVNAFINRAIEDNGHCIKLRSQENESVYFLSCSRDGLNLLLADLANIWARFDSATLFVETDQIGGQVMVDAVTAEQIAEIANQDGLKKRIKLAKDFVVLNNMAGLLPGKEILTAVNDRRPDLITIPKPVLTSREKTIKKLASPADDQMQVHLTIVVVSSE